MPADKRHSARHWSDSTDVEAGHAPAERAERLASHRRTPRPVRTPHRQEPAPIRPARGNAEVSRKAPAKRARPRRRAELYLGYQRQRAPTTDCRCSRKPVPLTPITVRSKIWTTPCTGCSPRYFLGARLRQPEKHPARDQPGLIPVIAICLKRIRRLPTAIRRCLRRGRTAPACMEYIETDPEQHLFHCPPDVLPPRRPTVSSVHCNEQRYASRKAACCG